MWRLLTTAVAFALPSWAVPFSASKIDWVECRNHPPSDTTGIDLNHLPTVLHCGRMQVPMDYAKPMGPDNNITLGLAMYRPPKPKGCIYFNPGGSDEATIFAWQAALNLTDEFAGLKDFDLLMVDNRGTYSSNPLNVSLAAFEPLLGAYPASEQEFEAFRNASAKVAQSWIDSSSPPGIAQFVGTKETVQDLNSVRAALGYNKIHFLGASYGSYRAIQYATIFPQHVDHIALDAIAPHGVNITTQVRDELAAVNRALFRADAYCQNFTDCPFRSQGRGSVLKAYRKVLDMAQQTPLNASICDASNLCKSPVDAVHVQQGVSDLLSANPDFPTLLEGLALALTGNGSILAAYALDPILSLDLVWAVPILCNDYNLSTNDWASFQASLKSGSMVDGNNIGRAEGFQIQLFCSGWPFPTPKQPPLPIKTKTMLLVTADFDASAPTEWSRLVWQQDSNSTLVVRHGDDHVSFQLPEQESSAITKLYLRTGELPKARKDVHVSVYPPGAKLDGIANPYQVPVGPAAGDITQ